MTGQSRIEQSRIEQLPAGLVRGRSTAERVADLLRGWITEGALPPDEPLSEETLGRKVGVSRNTLREAFRLLSHERLLVHRLHFGVFVRSLTEDDVRDLYRVRKLIEPAAVRAADQADPRALNAVLAAVEEGERAAADQQWVDVGTANMHFHQALNGLAGSQRLDEIMGRLLAELRLVFHVMPEPRTFHERYLTWNRQIADLLAAGELKSAEELLVDYLEAAESQLLAAFEEQRASAGGPPARPDAGH